MKFSGFLLAGFLFVYGHAYAQSEQKKDKIDLELTQCLDKKENQNTVGMCDCANEATEQWDKKLNEVYKRLLNKLDATGKNKLKEAQRQWVVFKEKEVEMVRATYGAQDGTIWQITIADRVMNITRQRAIDLEEMLEMLEQK
jgi:uncharacterized protein YecT (DUF1311 family)